MIPMTTGKIREILKSGDPEKIAEIDKNDLEIFFENEEQRTLYNAEGMKNLYLGICKDAIDEYKKAHKMTLFGINDHPKTTEEKEYETFFGSEFFLNVTGMRSQQQTIDMVEKTMIDEKKKKLQMAMITDKRK